MPIISSFPGNNRGGGTALGPASDIKTQCAAEKVYIKWTDPSDITAKSSASATWGGTLLIRKAGSPPADRKDGVTVVDSKVHNQYQKAYFCDTGLVNGTTYYYKLFPYTTDGVYTNDAAGEFTAIPTQQVSGIDTWHVSNIITAPAGDGKLSVKWDDPAEQIANDGVTLATWGATTVVLKEGSVPVSKDDAAAAKVIRVEVRNQHSSSALVISGLKNGTTYHVKLFPETTEGGVNDSAENEMTGVANRMTVAAVPEQNGSLTYSGAAQKPEWTNYQSSELTLGGKTVGTDAGTYDASFTPTTDYRWADETTAAKIVQWTIGKAVGTMTVAPTSVTLNEQALTATVTLEGNFDGTVQAAVTDPKIATASVSGKSVTISNVEKVSGETTATISCSEGTNYTAPENRIVSISAQFKEEKIYGVSWAGTSDSGMTRTDSAVDFVDPNPAVNNGTGSSPFDNIMPWSGMKRITDTEAGELVEIPKYWYKWTKSGFTLQLQIANYHEPGFFVSPAHADRGDGKGERDVVYVGRYHCASGYKSQTGVLPLANITRSAARSGIHGLGETIWQWDWAINWTIKMLYLVEFAHWNSQEKIGYGGGGSSTQRMGYTDSMGHHTGTTQANRTTYGFGTQYRYIEGLWGNVYDWVDGCYCNSDGLNVASNPSEFSDDLGGMLVGKPAGGFPTRLEIAEKNGVQWVYPMEAGGNGTTYIPDRWSFISSKPCLRVGGSYGMSLNCGLFSVEYYGVSSTSGSVGSRLMKLP